jgi:carboxyl-terminal processing protease
MKKRIVTITSLIMLVAMTFGSGYIIGTLNDEATPAAAQDSPERDETFAPFWEAWDLMHQYYVDPLDDIQLMEAALAGLMDAPGDPHMDYMNPDAYSQAREGLTSEYEGIGATVQQDEATGALVIVRPLPGSPAEASGILSGDEIVTVDGEDITGMDQSTIIGMVKGPAGTDVVLGVRRNGAEELVEITVTRAQISLPTVDFEILDGNIGYVILYSFSQNSDVELSEALNEMDVENLDGLIFDLRGNTGGYLDTTLRILSMFVERGVIFVERGPNGEEQVQAFGNAIAPTVPMVVLVDGYSASASEVVSGTLQDRGRARIVGVSTFGKGSVQTWRELSNGGGIRITISRWYTPDGHSVEPDGITPDVEVEYIPLEEGELYSRDTDNQLQRGIEELDNITTERPAAYEPTMNAN